VTFSVGNKVIGTYTPKAYSVGPVTHFSILGTNNPHDPDVINLSVLLFFLRDDSSSGQTGNIKIDPYRLALANNIKKMDLFTDTKKVDPEDFLVMLNEQAKKASSRITVPDKGTVLALAKAQTIADKILVPPYPSLVLPPAVSLSSRYLPCSAPNPYGFNFDFNEFKSTVTLSAGNSEDANGDKLSYQWLIDSKPTTSKALIPGTATDPQITVGIDADDEPYLFRVLVSDQVSNPTPYAICSANVKKTNIAGVYNVSNTQPSGPPLLQLPVLAISDTADVWGYTTSTVFAGVISPAEKPGAYAITSLISCQQDFTKTPAGAECKTPQLLSGGALALNNVQAQRTLTGSIGQDNLPSLTANTAPDAPTLFTSLAGTYRELGSDTKNWVISKTTLSFTDTVTTTVNGKTTSASTLCATGDMKTDANSQVLDANGAITKFMIPIKIEFKAACNDGFDPNSSSTGVLMPDASLGPGGFTFIGKNPNQSSLFVRHFLRR
jgi:hypothetical protein